MSDRRTLLDQKLPAIPLTETREGRVLVLGRLAEALLDGRMPDRESATFLGAALLAWLEQGGQLTRDYLKIDAPQGSRITPDIIWRSSHGVMGKRGRRR